MNFFQAQDRARRNTLLLVILFTAAVALTVLIVYYMLLFFTQYSEWESSGELIHNGWLLYNTTAIVLTIVLLGFVYKALLLSAGGGVVAQSMGGRLVMLDPSDPGERQLINIVDEMAIAAGIPIPDVYLLPYSGINAFAAGTTICNSVIGVTRGCLRHLSREQLQGVIAHEFSHIINGDMRTNIRLTAITHGLMLVGFIGYFLKRWRFGTRGVFHKKRNPAVDGVEITDSDVFVLTLPITIPMVIVGNILSAAGFIGTFFSSWIRAAISRQREYLADAAAVQFTRQPQGLAGALERIGQLTRQISSKQLDSMADHSHNLRVALSGGDEIRASHAIAYSHMFIASAVHGGISHPFSTHPPLTDRIRRLVPAWSEDNPINSGQTRPVDPTTPQAPVQQYNKKSAQDAVAAYSNLFGGSRHAGYAASAIVGMIGSINASSFHHAAEVMKKIPRPLISAAEDPFSARALIYVMLLDRRYDDIREIQLEHLRLHADTGVYMMTKELLSSINILRPAAILPLVQLTLPALRQLSARQYDLFLSNMEALIAADNQIELFQWCIEAFLVHALHRHFGKKHHRPSGGKKNAMAYALSILAKVGQKNPAGAFAHAVAVTKLPLTFIDDDFEPRRLLDSLQHVSGLLPKQKQQFARAAASCAAFNGLIDHNEATILRAYFMIIDCPLPLDVDETPAAPAIATAADA